jgi:hypothetical protein
VPGAVRGRPAVHGRHGRGRRWIGGRGDRRPRGEGRRDRVDHRLDRGAGTAGDPRPDEHAHHHRGDGRERMRHHTFASEDR